MKRIPYTGTNQADFKEVLGDRVLDPYFCMGLTILSILTDDGFVNVQEGDIVVIDCGQNSQKEMKTLVAYFSATGTTAAVAQDLADVTGGTLYEIKPEVKYTAADLDWRDKASRSSVEMQDKASRPAIVKDLKDAGSYDVVYIGFPVWWYTAPTIINTFIEAYGFEGKTVIFFATSGGSSIDKANKDFAAAYPAIHWKAGKTLNGASKADIKAWVDGLK